MNLSYWEVKSWFTDVDFTIVGSGIVGLNCALQLSKRFPKAKILILEKGILPQGASTKNAGFACFGSLSEILDDLKNHSEETVFKLIEKRVTGLNLLRETLGDKNIDYQNHGGYELFQKSDESLYNLCKEKQNEVNRFLKPIFKSDVFSFKPNDFNFENITSKYSFNRFEGQIDTGKMMKALLKKAKKNNVSILNNCTVEQFSQNENSVSIQLNNFEFSTKNLIIATNGFTEQLLNEPVKPARAQVLITKTITNLHIKGTFHLDKGYYYFRVAAGVPISGKNYLPQLHSIECRINAEDPFNDFRPSPGKITTLHAPGGHGVRLDTHVYAGYSIPPNYDSMIAKLITTAQTREEAINKMKRALDEFVIEGIKTTIPFHRQLMDHPDYLAGNYTTKFMEDFKIKEVIEE